MISRLRSASDFISVSLTWMSRRNIWTFSWRRKRWRTGRWPWVCVFAC